MKLPIYMDNHATTPVDPRVLERMLPYFTEHFGNAASRSHGFGWRAEEAVEAARSRVAALLNATAQEIVFTSGATESNNLALMGVMEAYAAKGNHLITQVTEHKAVLDVCKGLERRGVQVTYLPVDGAGRVDPQAVADAITPKTVLVSLMHVNNEVGTVHPLATVGAICRERGVLLHSDVAQSVGKLPLDVQAACVDVASLSGHKLYAPKGVGALFVRRRDPRVQLAAQQLGGGHERGMRSGTLNVPGIVGLGEACRIALAEGTEESVRLATLRDALAGKLLALGGVSRNGDAAQCHPGNLHLSFAGVEGDALILSLRDLAVSSGSACTSVTLEPSYVLRAMKVSDDLARASIRFGIGRFNTAEEVDQVAALVEEKLNKLRRTNGRPVRADKDTRTEP